MEYGNLNNKRVEELVRELIVEIGDDPTREGLVETPARVARAFVEMFRGYQKKDFNFKDFESPYSGIISRVGIPFYSYCEHHVLVFRGVAHFGYIPDGRVVGASKVIRFIQHTAARLTIQETLTEDIADTFMRNIKPRGCMVILSASHTCEACRGVKVADVPMITDTVRGIFADEPSVKAEFLSTVDREWRRK